MAFVALVLVLPTTSVCVAVIVSALSPNAVTSASTTAIDHAPLASTNAVFPPASVRALVKLSVTVAPTSPVPVMLKPANASASLTVSSVATVEMTGAFGTLPSTVGKAVPPVSMAAMAPL